MNLGEKELPEELRGKIGIITVRKSQLMSNVDEELILLGKTIHVIRQFEDTLNGNLNVMCACEYFKESGLKYPQLPLDIPSYEFKFKYGEGARMILSSD
jgi:hypothetical protein